MSWTDFYERTGGAVALQANAAASNARRQAKPTTLEERARQARYERRSNVCPVCRLAKPRSGSCC